MRLEPLSSGGLDVMCIFVHLFTPLCNALDLGIQPPAAVASLRSSDHDGRAHTAVSIVDLTDDYCTVHELMND